MTAAESAGEPGLLAEIYQDVTTKPSTMRLPDRVMTAISRQEDASEVLIKLIQFAVVVIFGVLYAIAPKTDAGTDFSPVPYVLGGYFAATVLGLIWALNARLPDWAVYVSIVLDMSLLMGLLLSYHIQYEQPASFFLKAPTLLYVFIFIALRSLRFRPRFVLA
ncbi:MAG: adenylate/guanylate cyclase domain-containing protein, partial [Methyloligellaceae bacterium]